MTTTKRAQAQIVADCDGDPFAVTVEAVDTFRLHGDTTRVRWAWSIRSATDAAEWMPERRWIGNDLTSAIDVADPDPIAALVTLASFLDDYADVRVLDPHDTGALFYGLPQDVARSIAQAIMLEFPEDPTCPECGGPMNDDVDPEHWYCPECVTGEDDPDACHVCGNTDDGAVEVMLDGALVTVCERHAAAIPEDPTCDYCGRRQDDTLDMIWDGDTGCHVECERGCEGCLAEPGEPCRPGCLSQVTA